MTNDTKASQPERAEAPEAPEAPCHLNNTEASQWQSGWESGWLARASKPPAVAPPAAEPAIQPEGAEALIDYFESCCPAGLDCAGAKDAASLEAEHIEMMSRLRTNLARASKPPAVAPHTGGAEPDQILPWAIQSLRTIADRGRAGLGDSYPEILTVLMGLKALARAPTAEPASQEGAHNLNAAELGALDRAFTRSVRFVEQGSASLAYCGCTSTTDGLGKTTNFYCDAHKPQEPAAEAGEPVRTDFELWAYTQGWRNFTRGIGGRYVVEGDLELRWIGWRACAEAHPHPEASPPAMPESELRAAMLDAAIVCERPDKFGNTHKGTAAVLRQALASTTAPEGRAPEDKTVLRAADSTERENAYWNKGFEEGFAKGKEVASRSASDGDEKLRTAAQAAIDYWRDRSADIGGMEQRIKRLDEALARTTPQPDGAEPTSAGRKS